MTYIFAATLFISSLAVQFFGSLHWIDTRPTNYRLEKPVGETAEAKILLGQKIDINRASVDDLTVLKGIGPALARAIISYRRANGPFQSIYEIKEVHGIGEAKFRSVSQFIDIR